MLNYKRSTIYLLLLLFGFLSFKNLVPTLEVAPSNCQEIGHIHHYNLNKKSSTGAILLQKKSLSSEDDDDSDACHEGKTFNSYPPSPSIQFEAELKVVFFNYKLVLNLENHFNSPYLEPFRKPPKIS